MGARHVIAVVEEHETDRGWRFGCDLAGCGYAWVRLDWSDYDHWCPGGDISPSIVVERVLTLMSTEGLTIPSNFDIARIHRLLNNPEAVHQAIRPTTNGPD
ncbi:MAG: hypothetical protein MK077_05890 [Phycisphaerales bacterium]|nr:hypothetical protein [Phycisphaerales bacterium]